MLGWRWLKPDEPAPGARLPRGDVQAFRAWLARHREQRAAGSQTACEMASHCHFFFESQIYGRIPSELDDAVRSFNIMRHQYGSRFQWFTETIQGPLQVLEVRAEHTRGCALCHSRPMDGEVYFKFNVTAPKEYSKFCETCGAGVLYAALCRPAENWEEAAAKEAEQEEQKEEASSEKDEEKAPAAQAATKGSGRAARSAPQQKKKQQRQKQQRKTSGVAAARAAQPVAAGTRSRKGPAAAAGQRAVCGKRGPTEAVQAAQPQRKKRRSSNK